MNVEREIAGITLPFIAALAATIYADGIIQDYTPVAIVSIFLCLSTLALLWAFRSTKRSFLIIMVAMALCGIFVGSSGMLLECSGGGIAGPLQSAARGFGERMSRAINSIPFNSSSTSSLIDALITGERSGIPREVTEAFRESGASHILSISGMHLGIIYGIIRKTLSIIGNTPLAKNIKSIITVAACIFYSMATGACPSIVRSLLFIIIMETASITGRTNVLKTTLLTSMLLQLTVSPLSIKDIGFQLSYAAMAGIAYIYPPLKAFWPGSSKDDDLWTRCMRWIWDSAALSIACQLTTGPLAYIYFQSFPTHFILTNLIAIPLTGLIIPASLLTLIGHLSGYCPDILIKTTEMLVSTLSEALKIISSM